MIQISRISTLTIAAVICMAANVWSAPGGGGDEPKKDSQAELREKADKEYKKGLEKLMKAKEYEAASDSLFAYNYRATSDAKARKEYEKAIEKFDKALKLDDTHFAAHSDRGYCLRKLGLLDESLKAYNTALELSPEYGPALEYRGEAYLALGKLKEAEAALAQLKALAEKHESRRDEYTDWANTLAASIEKYHLERFKDGDSARDSL